MKTLKDIKVSSVRPPLQNSIWLRPMGNKQFKLYYPHGGDWSEVTVDTDKEHEDDSSVKELSEKVSEIEGTQEEIIKSIDSLQLSSNALAARIAKIDARLLVINSDIKSLQTSIGRLYESVDLSKLVLTKAFQLEEQLNINLIDYGIDSYYWNAILNLEAKKAIIPGYDSPFYITVEINYSKSSFAIVSKLIDFTLLTETSLTNFRILGHAIHAQGLPPQESYSTVGSEFTIDSNTTILKSCPPQENQFNTTVEKIAADYGFSLDVIFDLISKGRSNIVFEDYPHPFICEASGEVNDYFDLQIFRWDDVLSKESTYTITGALVNNVWAVDIEYVESNQKGHDYGEEEIIVTPIP